MKLYIIPAYEETIKDEGYPQIIVEAKKKKYKVFVLNLQIKNKSLDDLINKAVKIIRKGTDSVIFGFSIGALIAFCISKKIAIKKGLFCSISPILGKDALKNLKINQKYLGKETVEELKKTRYGKTISKEPVFICGDKEEKKLIERTKKLHRTNGGKLIIVKNNKHKLTKNYIKEIIKNL